MPLKKATASDLEAATAGLRAAWGERAACRRDAGLLDPDSPDWVDEATAVAVCRACPVIAECRKWVLALPASVDVGGVCGGLTEHERARARAGGWEPGGGTKFCPSCRVIKPATEFWRDRTRPDGLKRCCKPCTTEMDRRTVARRRALTSEGIPS